MNFARKKLQHASVWLLFTVVPVQGPPVIAVGDKTITLKKICGVAFCARCSFGCMDFSPDHSHLPKKPTQPSFMEEEKNEQMSSTGASALDTNGS